MFIEKSRYDSTAQLFGLLATLLMVSACSGKPYALKETDVSIEEAQEIFIVRDNLHTGLVLPANTIQSLLPTVYQRFPGSPYIEFGWGDKEYYQSEETTFGMTVIALFWPSDSVIRAVAVPQRPDIHSADWDVEVLCLDNKQYALLIDFIAQSFSRGDEGQVLVSSTGLEVDTEFYAAEGDYTMWNTCNTWTAKGLKSAQQDISSAFKMTAGSVMGAVEKIKQSPLAQSCKPVVVSHH